MQFRIKGKDYFLSFVEEEGRWYLFAPTLTGVERIPMYVDAAKYEGAFFRQGANTGVLS
jgi:hypothetical protein